MELHADPLSVEAFHPYGSIISPDEEIATYTSSHGVAENNANQGTAVKLLSVSRVQNSSRAAVPHLNLFRCRTRGRVSQGQSWQIVVPLLERHPQSSQTFIPMGVDSEAVAYIVVVALVLPNDTSKPDMSTARAFLCRGNQAVTYGEGVSHAPMIAISQEEARTHIDFAVLIYENDSPGHPELDCVEYQLDRPIEVTVTV